MSSVSHSGSGIKDLNVRNFSPRISEILKLKIYVFLRVKDILDKYSRVKGFVNKMFICTEQYIASK
jgi:hypothetical protein